MQNPVSPQNIHRLSISESPAYHTTNSYYKINSERISPLISEKVERKLESREEEMKDRNNNSRMMNPFSINEMKRKLDLMLKQTEAWQNLHSHKLEVNRTNRNSSFRTLERRSMRESRGHSLLSTKWRNQRRQENSSFLIQESEGNSDCARRIRKPAATDRLSKERDEITEDRESWILEKRNKKCVELNVLSNSMENPENERNELEGKNSWRFDSNNCERSFDENCHQFHEGELTGSNESLECNFCLKSEEWLGYEKVGEEEKLAELQEKFLLLSCENENLQVNLKQIEANNRNLLNNGEKLKQEVHHLIYQNEQMEAKRNMLRETETKEKEELRKQIEDKVLSINEERNQSRALIQKHLQQNQIFLNYLTSTKEQEELTEQNSQYEKDLQRIVCNFEIKQIKVKDLNSQMQEKDKKINIFNQSLSTLKLEIEELKHFKEKLESENYNNFDSILMTQIQEISSVKERIETFSEEISEFKDKLMEKEGKNQAISNEMKIAEMKKKSELNNKKMEDEIKSNEQDNIIDHLNKKMQTLQHKYASIVGEIIEKDNFLKQHLLGRAESEEEKRQIERILSKTSNSKIW